jgi:pimeloyl-ACP methyl ester carboxylesterase
MNWGDPVENAKEATREFLVADESAVPSPFYELLAAGQQLPGRQRSLRSLTTEQGSFGHMHSLFDLRDEIADIERPTAFVWGDQDSFWPPAVGRSVAEQMANAEFHELPDHGHMPWMEPSDKAKTRIRSFLN